MKEELLRFHRKALVLAEKGLCGWTNTEALHGDEKCKTEHIAIFKELVGFHERAIEWLEIKGALPHAE